VNSESRTGHVRNPNEFKAFQFQQIGREAANPVETLRKPCALFGLDVIQGASRGNGPWEAHPFSQPVVQPERVLVAANMNHSVLRFCHFKKMNSEAAQ